MFKKRITSLFMAICLLAGTAISTASVHAEASPQPTKGTDTAGSEASASVVMSKVLTMDPSVVTPDKTFTFTVKKESLNGTAVTDEGDTTMPVIGKTFTLNTKTPTAKQNATISTKYSATNASGSYHDALAVATDKYKAITMTTTDLLNGVTFTHAGVYVYSITENTQDPADATIENTKAKYTMVVYVANKYAEGGASYSDGVYVSAVGVWNTLDKDGGTVADANTSNPQGDGVVTAGFGTKVDATLTSGLTDVGSQFEFVNNYVPLSPLMIEKTVSGAYADRTLEFTFSTILSIPSTATGADTYTALVCKNGAQVGTDTVIFTKNETYTKTYTLSDGEYLLFVDDITNKNGILPVGTTYTVSETPIADYTPSVKVYYANGTAARVQDNNAAISAGGVVSTTNATNNSKLIVGDVQAITDVANKIEANQTVVNNAYKTVTPTGIIMDNLPGILLVVIAVAGMCMYLYFRNKKHKDA